MQQMKGISTNCFTELLIIEDMGKGGSSGGDTIKIGI